jgi:hypothetical protein
MTVRIGKVELIGVQDIYTEETRNLVEQRVPDQKGSVFQDLGRDPVTVVIVGLLFGREVLSNLEQLRQAQEKADPLPFAADIAIGTELTEVIIEDLKMRQLAGYVDRYRFALRVREHVAPPESPEKALAAVNEGISADADAFATDSIAAGGALQDPSDLANVLADNPGALAQISADDLAGAVADHTDKLSADNLEEIFKSVGSQDPAKLGNMLNTLKEKGTLGQFMEKFADAGKDLLQVLKDINLTELAKGIVSLFSAGVKLVQLLKTALSDIKKVWKIFEDKGLVAGLKEFLKTGIEELHALITNLNELVSGITKVVEALEEEKDMLAKVAEKLNCRDSLNRIINSISDWLSKAADALGWIGNQLVDLGGVSGLLGTARPILIDSSNFIKAICEQVNKLFTEPDSKKSDNGTALSDQAGELQATARDCGNIFEKKSGKMLTAVWEVSEAVLGLERPIFDLQGKIGDLRESIKMFAVDSK